MMWERGAVTALARRYGWSLADDQPNIGLLIFRKSGKQVNCYITTRTVSTALAHPTKGKTQLFRRHVSLAMLEAIFQNPRVHTGIGYYHRDGSSPVTR